MRPQPTHCLCKFDPHIVSAAADKKNAWTRLTSTQTYCPSLSPTSIRLTTVCYGASPRPPSLHTHPHIHISNSPVGKLTVLISAHATRMRSQIYVYTVTRTALPHQNTKYGIALITVAAINLAHGLVPDGAVPAVGSIANTHSVGQRTGIPEHFIRETLNTQTDIYVRKQAPPTATPLENTTRIFDATPMRIPMSTITLPPATPFDQFAKMKVADLKLNSRKGDSPWVGSNLVKRLVDALKVTMLSAARQINATRYVHAVRDSGINH
jgi:hypothetical protein